LGVYKGMTDLDASSPKYRPLYIGLMTAFFAGGAWSFYKLFYDNGGLADIIAGSATTGIGLAFAISEYGLYRKEKLMANN